MILGLNLNFFLNNFHRKSLDQLNILNVNKVIFNIIDETEISFFYDWFCYFIIHSRLRGLENLSPPVQKCDGFRSFKYLHEYINTEIKY